MATIDLTLRNATDTWQIQGVAQQEETIGNLINSLISQLNLPLAGQSSQLGELLTLTGESATLYHPRQGILDPQKKVKEYGALFDEPLVFYAKCELSEMVPSLSVDIDKPFETFIRLATIKWESNYYPILLPAKSTPQGNIEGSLLSTLVVQQINQIEKIQIDPTTIPAGHYYNHRTKTEIHPLDRDSLIGDLISHGDLLEYRTAYTMPTGEPASGLDIVIVNDAGESSTSESNISESSTNESTPDDSLLAEITISPIEDEN